MTRKTQDTQFSEPEAQRRFEAALRAGLKTPAKPHEEMRLGKRKKRRDAEKSDTND